MIRRRLTAQGSGDLAEVATSRSLLALDGDAPVAAVQCYLRGFTGAHFETMGRVLGPAGPVDPAPNVFTTADALSPSLLSAPLKPSEILDLLRANVDLADHLAAIGDDQPIADAEDYDGDEPSRRWRAAKDAFDRLQAVDGVGRTRATKLLHRKRPHLIPVWDSVVSAALGYRRHDDWRILQLVARNPDVAGRLADIRLAVGQKVPGDPPVTWMSDLRLLDIVVWMRAGGARRAGGPEDYRDLLIPELVAAVEA